MKKDRHESESQDLVRVVREVKERLIGRSETLCLAESCTGGLISAAIAAEPGVSEFFRGSVVSYSGDLKVDILNVPRSALQVHGEVSLPVARSMARGARALMRSTWALSVTGIAGPTGGSADKPVGTVCFALVGPGIEELVGKCFVAAPSGPQRQDIQRQAGLFALELLLRQIRV